MPFRSMKMNFFILGFHRRVWCPKWTPASRSSFMPMSATVFLRSWSSAPSSRRSAPGWGARTFGLGRAKWRRPQGTPRRYELPLGELEALARRRLPVLLAFLHARVAREEALLAQERPDLRVRLLKGARHAERDRARLAGVTSSVDGGDHVEFVERVAGHERLRGDTTERDSGKVTIEIDAVHEALARAGCQPHAGHRGFPPPRSDVLGRQCVLTSRRLPPRPRQRPRRLRRVRVLGSGVDFELLDHGAPELVLREHALHG